MKLTDFTYKLPKELIAQTPLQNRSDSRMLVVDRTDGRVIDTKFNTLIDYLNAGDVLVLNDTEVIPARLIGIKDSTNALIEILLLKQERPDTWECLVKGAKKVKKGTIITFGVGLIKAQCLEVRNEGLRLFKMDYEGIFYELLEQLGETPLPPYIHSKLQDKTRYQTVYSKHKGSAAAPTAGLHFTHEYLEKLQTKKIQVAYVTLHVGLGTFRPVTVDNIEEHTMHEEYYAIDELNANIIALAVQEGRRIVAVGTTALRTLETVIKNGTFVATSGVSNLFIYPGFKFKIVDALLTNFHLPESTLLMLISAFSSREIVLKSYDYAIREKYRFFSFGDAMFLTTLKK